MRKILKSKSFILHLIIFAAIFPLITFAQTQQEIQKAQRFFEEGDLASKSGNFQAAIENYTQAIFLYPTAFQLYFVRGIAYRNIRQYDLSIKDFDKAVEFGSNLPTKQIADIYAMRGTVLQEKGDYTMALENLDKAISLNSEDGRYYLNRGSTYQFLKNTI